MNGVVNNLVFLLASGNAFFVGLSTAAVGLITGGFKLPGWSRSLLRIAGLFGISLVLLSSTPIPIWEYLLLFSSWLVPAVSLNHAPRSRVIAVSIFCLLAIAASLGELRYHVKPKVHLLQNHPVYVIGDSLSAGLGHGDEPWTASFQKRTGLKTINLSEPGATVSSALEQTTDLRDPDGFVLVEIGGNDMLGDTDPNVFRANLERLLEKIHRSNPRSAMFEIPLLPLKSAFGRAQRTLAKQYGVALIPKNCLSRILQAKSATSDGLHLTKNGAEMFSDTVIGLLDVD